MINSRYEKDGFLFSKSIDPIFSSLEDSLIVGNDLNKTLKYICDNGIKSFIINSNNYSLGNLDFLKDVPQVESLILLIDDIQLPQFDSMINIKMLSFQSIKNGIDLSFFRKLEALAFDHWKKITGLENCHNLFWLSINGYKEPDLSKLNGMKHLKYLFLYNAGIKSLRGIEGLSHLKEFRVDNAKKMESLSGLTEVQNTIEVLDIYNAQKLTDYSALKNMTSLKQLDLRRTGDIDSIEFIKYLTKIERITLGLKVKNGDMSFLKNIDSVGFIDYPHYNLKHKDFQN